MFLSITKNCVRRVMSVAVLAWVCVWTAFADSALKGRITDQNNQPIEFATASLLNAQTKVPVKGSVSDSTGRFFIAKVHPGEYILSVSLIGYKKYETGKIILKDNQETKLEKNVILFMSAQQLKEAVVTSKVKFIEQQADKMVINPEASITTASDNVYDILKKTPGITVDDNNNISLKGKQGITVLIDEKPTYLSADQLAAMLKGMQGKDIDRIEIIENPSSRYDAEGNSGIINIKTKHEKRAGFNGNLFGGLRVSDKTRGNGGLNLNMNLGKVNVYGNYSYYNWAGWNKSENSRSFLSGPDAGSFEDISSKYDYQGHTHNYKVGADYYLTKKQVISIMFRGSNGSNNDLGLSHSAFKDNQHQLDSTLFTSSNNKDSWRDYTYNVNYKWDIDSTGQSLIVDADYARFYSGSISDQVSQFFDANGNTLNLNSKINGNQNGKITIATAKTDYVHPINKRFSWEAGIKTSFVSNHAQMNFDFSDPNNVILSTGLQPNDDFLYTENINAAYLSGHGKFGKTSLQLGLRMENTNSKGDSKSMDRTDYHHYTNLFPSLFAQHAFNEDNQLGLSYSYRIGRPGYDQLNPFLWMLDLYTYQKGNPFLRPKYTDALGLNYTYKNKFITSFGYNHTRDLFTQVIEQNDVTKVIFQTDKNLSKSTDLNGTETVQLDFAKWWHINTTLTGMYKRVVSDVENMQTLSRWSYMAYMTNSFSLPYNIGIELSGRYMSKQLWGSFVINDRYSADLGIQKSLLKDKGTLKLSLNDIFNTNHGGGYARYGNVDLTSLNHWDSRQLNMTFTYRFGKDTFKTRASRSTASSEEQSRSNGKEGND